uniref:Coiled-coil-helix-coiled-coil-helix domain containing 4a n=1 Tax=Oncorhynchus kisutch TaxID=8019 RepID=A0A8C7GGJ6_ONCKI
MSYCKQEGKDRIIFVTKEDHEAPSNAELIADDPNDPYEDQGLILPSGEINWNCPCLGGMASGPCGTQFKEAFSCFHYSNEERTLPQPQCPLVTLPRPHQHLNLPRHPTIHHQQTARLPAKITQHPPVSLLNHCRAQATFMGDQLCVHWCLRLYILVQLSSQRIMTLKGG